MRPRSAAYPRADYTVPLLAGAVLGEAIEVKGSSQVAIANLGAVNLNATFQNVVYTPTRVVVALVSDGGNAGGLVMDLSAVRVDDLREVT